MLSHCGCSSVLLHTLTAAWPKNPVIPSSLHHSYFRFIQNTCTLENKSWHLELDINSIWIILWCGTVFRRKVQCWCRLVNVLSSRVSLWRQRVWESVSDRVWQWSKFGKWWLHIREFSFQESQISPLIRLLWTTAWLLACQRARSFPFTTSSTKKICNKDPEIPRRENKRAFVLAKLVKIRKG